MFKRKFLSLASLTAILASMISISANAEVKRTKLDSMKEVYYIFNFTYSTYYNNILFW